MQYPLADAGSVQGWITLKFSQIYLNYNVLVHAKQLYLDAARYDF